MRFYSKAVLVIIFSVCVFGVLMACRKQESRNSEFVCTYSTPNAVPRGIYNYSQIIPINYSASHCGFLPLNKNNYWLFRDSLFHYPTGQFAQSYEDTLRFIKTYETPDNIIWWEPKSSTIVHTAGYNRYHGYYNKMYANDTALYSMGEAIFTQFLTHNWCRNIPGSDTLKNITRWDDVSEIDESAVKLSSPVTVPAGVFSDCFLYIKTNFADWRWDIYFKPGVGIIKSTFWMSTAPFSPLFISHNSELLSYHLE